MTAEQATAVYELLAKHPDELRHFVYHQTRRVCPEFRLYTANLGFGGKFRITGDRWYVDFYQEDWTSARQRPWRP